MHKDHRINDIIDGVNIFNCGFEFQNSTCTCVGYVYTVPAIGRTMKPKLVN